MSAPEKTLRELTDAELLYALIKRNGSEGGPHRSVYAEGVRETLVAVGPDHTVSVRFFPEDFQALVDEVRTNKIRCSHCGAEHPRGAR